MRKEIYEEVQRQLDEVFSEGVRQGVESAFEEIQEKRGKSVPVDPYQPLKDSQGKVLSELIDPRHQKEEMELVSAWMPKDHVQGIRAFSKLVGITDSEMIMSLMGSISPLMEAEYDGFMFWSQYSELISNTTLFPTRKHAQAVCDLFEKKWAKHYPKSTKPVLKPWDRDGVKGWVIDN